MSLTAEPSGPSPYLSHKFRQPGIPRSTDFIQGSDNDDAKSFGTLSPAETLDRPLHCRKGEVRCSWSSIEGGAEFLWKLRESV